MAALLNPKDRGFVVRITNRDGEPRKITLPKFKGKPHEQKREAEQYRYRIAGLEKLHRFGGEASPELNLWLESLGPQMLHRIVNSGLIVVGEEPQELTTLGQFTDSYLLNRRDDKQSTLTVYQQTIRNLVECYGVDRELSSLTPGDADRFPRHLKRAGMADTTINRRTSLARTVFTAAFRLRLISENPFADVRAGSRHNKSKMFHVDLPSYFKLIDAAQDAEWRAIIALARIGGLRCPSEILSLRWQDIDWASERIVVTSPKTEHVGKGSRVIPLFPELVEPLREAFEQAAEGAEFVIEKHRPSKLKTNAGNWMQVNLRTGFSKIVKRAGLTQWPRLFQNLRASRETELSHSYPIQVVTEWLGNTPQIAMGHYLQVTDADFSRAAKNGTEFGTARSQNGTEFGTDAEPHGTTPRGEKFAIPREKEQKRPTVKQMTVGHQWRIGDLNP